MVIPRGTDSAKVIKVIETKSLIGSGTENDPVRTIYQYWNLKGQLLAKFDSFKDKLNYFEFDEINCSASSEVNS